MTFYWLTMRRDYLCSDLAELRARADAVGNVEQTDGVLRRNGASVNGAPHSRRSALARVLTARSSSVSLAYRVRIGGHTPPWRRRTPEPDDVQSASQDVFASQLPCCDIVSVGESKYQSISADYEWVVGMNEEVRHRATACLFDVNLSCAQHRVM
jgi:hypothetical protein